MWRRRWPISFSILPNYLAWCRLIHYPEEAGKHPELAEWKITTEELGKGQANPAMAAYIRERSRALAPTRESVQSEIDRRLGPLSQMGYLNTQNHEVQAVEEI